MAEKKIDPRVSRTCRALQSAFIELMLTRGYKTVAVGDIVRRANVGRSTFYLHYAGKEALLRETLKNPSGGLAETKLAGARGVARGQPLIPRSLLATLLAETQIALITHWLSGTVPVSAESIAQALIVNTRALLASDVRYQRPG